MKKAFSLIELSIVILIIGILIAGVTQGSRLLNKARLSNARTITQSSPVSSIRGIGVWFDSTSEKSFDSKIDNEDPVSSWKSINPQSTTDFEVTQSTSTLQPKYISSGINNLPVVDFDGSDDCLKRANTNTSDLFSAKEVTLFIVQKYGGSAAGTTANIGFLESVDNDRLNLHLPYVTGDIILDLSEDCCDSRLQFNTPSNFYKIPHIITVTRLNSLISFRMDGTELASDSNNTVDNPVNKSTTFTIGCWGVLDATYLGQIGEVIIFDRYLKSDERQDVEEYLSKKWGISI